MISVQSEFPDSILDLILDSILNLIPNSILELIWIEFDTINSKLNRVEWTRVARKKALSICIPFECTSGFFVDSFWISKLEFLI